MHVDLASFGERDFDLEERVLVSDLGLRHPSSTRFGECRLGRARERGPGDRLLVIVAGTGDGKPCRDRRGDGDYSGDVVVSDAGGGTYLIPFWVRVANR